MYDVIDDDEYDVSDDDEYDVSDDAMYCYVIKIVYESS
jgi:hypothetical protein